jgi:hypothetical protein
MFSAFPHSLFLLLAPALPPMMLFAYTTNGFARTRHIEKRLFTMPADLVLGVLRPLIESHWRFALFGLLLGP